MMMLKSHFLPRILSQKNHDPFLVPLNFSFPTIVKKLCVDETLFFNTSEITLFMPQVSLNPKKHRVNQR